MDEDAAAPKHSVPLSRRWQTGEVGFPTLVVLLLVLGAAGPRRREHRGLGLGRPSW